AEGERAFDEVARRGNVLLQPGSAVVVEVASLDSAAAVAGVGRYGRAHFRSCGDRQGRVGSDPDGEVEGTQVLFLVAVDVAPNFELDRGQVAEPARKLLGHPDSRQVAVAGRVAEPSAHLKQRVVR